MQSIPRRSLATLALALVPCGALAAQTPEPASAPYRDAHRPANERVADLLARMTLEDKFWQLFMIPGDLDDPSQDYSHGVFGLQTSVSPRGAPPPAATAAARAHAERINAMQHYFVERTRLGIPMIPFEEALHGVAKEGATVFPQAIGLAATWDTALVGRVATAIARETRSRGIRQVLSPVINIANDVRWGRVEETYGEDPYLTSRMAVSFVKAMEGAGIVATPKHFIANVGDGGRDSYPIDFDARLLDELFFPPFKASVQEAHARSVMSAYNSVDGLPASQNHALLTDKLRGDWGFTGFVISDAAAVGGATVLHHTEASTATATKDALNAGLDVIFQSSYEQHRPYLDAFRRGIIADSTINTAVARVLRAKFELGLFDHPYVDPDSAAHWNGNPEHRALARDAARESIVLLRNERATLPLRKDARAITVIGTDATEARLGGYSSAGIKKTSILDGIREAVAKTTTVRFAPGPGRVSKEYAIVPSENLSAKSDSGVRRGLRGEYFDNNRLEGSPRVVRTDERVDFGWTLNSPARGIPFDWYSVRWTGTLTAPRSGVRQIGVEGNDGYRLWIDGRLVIDNWRKQSYGVRMATVNLASASSHEVRLEYFESTGNARVKLVWDAGIVNRWRQDIDSAVAVAKRSDVAVVVAGLEEGEFRDRAYLKLPGHQEELIERVAATGKPTVVVLVGGSAITMGPWLDKAAAVIDVWYPGEEGGHGIADVLFGDADPAGRLPITFPVFEGQLPLVYNHKPTGRGDDYLDLTGQALFPFGFGLTYTSFEYSNLSITPTEMNATGSTTVRCRVKNTGARAGDEVVQLYIHDVLASVARPVLMLEGFTRIHLQPGEEREVSFTLSPEELQMLDANMHWIVEPGAFRVMVGASSKDIRLRGEAHRQMNRRQFVLASVTAAAAPQMLRGRAHSRPTPSAAQLAWQRDELAMFLHFGVNTFTDREWGDGTEDPSIFAPTRLDARQWAKTARAAGFRAMILTAKHHDGFCLWPTRTTQHSVAKSPFRGGQGDVVREFVDACRAEGLHPGLYLSPWDRNASVYGDSSRYNDFYMDQLTELLTQYGDIAEVWFDGANGEGPNGRKQTYDWPRTWGTVRRLQPNAVMFSDAGPDVRWIGNESGTAGDTNWSTVDPAVVPYPGASGDAVMRMLQHGDPSGSVWRPGETDVSIRPGWFHHAAEDARVRSAENLVGLYFTSVGRNSKLLLNVPPTRDGLLHDADVAALAATRARRDEVFANNVIAAKTVRWRVLGAREATTEIDLGAPTAVSIADLREDITQGQIVARYEIQGERDGTWITLSEGTTIGYRKLDRFTPTTVTRARLTIRDALETPRRIDFKLFGA